MITDLVIIETDLNRMYSFRPEAIKYKLKPYFENLLSKNIKINDFWEKNKQDLEEIFYTLYDMKNYDSKSLFIKFRENYIEDEFAKSISITKNFNDYLIHNYGYSYYFNWLKQFILQFFRKDEIIHFHGICDYKVEIENPDKKRILIKIDIPIDNFDLILDLLENFIKVQEELIKREYPIFLSHFKRTYFIFRSIFKG